MILTVQKEGLDDDLFLLLLRPIWTPRGLARNQARLAEVEGRLPASAMAPPHNSLFCRSSLGWGIGQIVYILRSYLLSSICIHIMLHVVCIGKFPLLSVWKELPFNCRQIHTIYTSQIWFSERVLSAVWPELLDINILLSQFAHSQYYSEFCFGASVCYWRVCSLLKSDESLTLNLASLLHSLENALYIDYRECEGRVTLFSDL